MFFARELIESAAYSASLSALGNPERLDDALRGAYWALSTNPEVYEINKGLRDVRVLKTAPLGGLPSYRIWFRIDEGGQHVHLEDIDVVEQDEA